MSTVNFSIESAQAYIQHLRLEQHVQDYRIKQLEKKVDKVKTLIINSAGYDVDSIGLEPYGTLEDGFWTDDDMHNF